MRWARSQSPVLFRIKIPGYSAAEDSGSYNNAVLRRARFNHFLKEAGSKRPQGYQEVLWSDRVWRRAIPTLFPVASSSARWMSPSASTLASTTRPVRAYHFLWRHSRFYHPHYIYVRRDSFPRVNLWRCHRLDRRLIQWDGRKIGLSYPSMFAVESITLARRDKNSFWGRRFGECRRNDKYQ